MSDNHEKTRAAPIVESTQLRRTLVNRIGGSWLAAVLVVFVLGPLGYAPMRGYLVGVILPGVWPAYFAITRMAIWFGAWSPGQPVKDWMGVSLLITGVVTSGCVWAGLVPYGVAKLWAYYSAMRRS